jgi:hypothetical protein
VKKSNLAKISLLVLSLFLLLPFFLATRIASAHEDRDINGGKYQFRVGWISEPTYQGIANGLELLICRGKCDSKGDGTYSNGETGAFDTLKAEVIYGSQSMPLTLLPVPRNPGKYDALFIPTKIGDYAFHFFGSIGQDKIDEKFVSSPNTFDSVQPLTAIQFPDKPGFNSAVQVATNVPSTTTTPAAASVSSSDVQALKDQLLVQQKTAQDAKSAADNAALFGVVGLVAGAVGILIGVGAMIIGLRSRVSSKPTEPEKG